MTNDAPRHLTSEHSRGTDDVSGPPVGGECAVPAARPDRSGEFGSWTRDNWSYLLPVLFAGAISLHYLGSAISWPTSMASATPLDLPQFRIEAPPPIRSVEKVVLAVPPALPLSARASQPVRIAPRRDSSPALPPELTEARTSIDDGGTKSIVSIVGDANGLHVYRSSRPEAAASTGFTKGQIPTGGQLDAMEFVVDVSPGSLEELVRNVDGAFFRNRRLYDARGNAVSSMDRYQTGSRLIVFFAVDGAMQVVLPTTVVDAVLRQVAAKSPAHTPRRVTAHFDASGMLRNVDIDA